MVVGNFLDIVAEEIISENSAIDIDNIEKLTYETINDVYNGRHSRIPVEEKRNIILVHLCGNYPNIDKLMTKLKSRTDTNSTD